MIGVFDDALRPEWLTEGLVQHSVSPSAFPWWPGAAHWFLFHVESSMNSSSLVSHQYQPWLYSVVAATLVGSAGVIPLLLIPADYGLKTRKDGCQFGVLELLLSFAVGGLLADVFLHLLPEAWAAAVEGGSTPREAFTGVGLCVLIGIFVFVVVEMMASDGPSSSSSSVSSKGSVNGRGLVSNGSLVGHTAEGLDSKPAKIKVIGYLNLVANGIDNFAHGLAVAGSFLVSYKTGVLTTTAILIHEIPHEIGDFAILLKSGFSRWEAARAQLYTASIGLMGAICTLLLGTSEIIGGIHVYILGFTAGCFLNIALVTVLPDLLQEERPIHSAAQFCCLLLGTATMASVAMLC